MKVRLHWTIRLRRWAARTGKKAGRYLVSLAISIAAMLILMDALGIYYGQETASDIAARAAVAAAQVLRQGADRSLAEKEALAMTERSLARFERIEFRGSEVEVTVVYKTRSIIFRHVPWLKNWLTITASGVHSSASSRS